MGNAQSFTEIFFGDNDINMTVNCFDEDSEMSIVIRGPKKKCIYSMNIWEAKELVKFIKGHLKNNQ